MTFHFPGIGKNKLWLILLTMFISHSLWAQNHLDQLVRNAFPPPFEFQGPFVVVEDSAKMEILSNWQLDVEACLGQALDSAARYMVIEAKDGRRGRQRIWGAVTYKDNQAIIMLAMSMHYERSGFFSDPGLVQFYLLRFLEDTFKHELIHFVLRSDDHQLPAMRQCTPWVPGEPRRIRD
jgi:hypothetical protein